MIYYCWINTGIEKEGVYDDDDHRCARTQKHVRPRLLPHLVQSFGTNFVLPTRLYGTNFLLVQFFCHNLFFWYKNVRVRVRPQEPDLRSVNAFGHFQNAFARTYGLNLYHGECFLPSLFKLQKPTPYKPWKPFSKL